MNNRAYTIIITGGGTGGHLLPGISIARAFLEVNPNNTIVFVGTGNEFEKRVLARYPFRHLWITAEGFLRRGIKGMMGSLAKVPLGIIQSLMILKRIKPDLVLGMGGYSAGPVVLAAWMLNIKTVLHEQNIIPGVTNRCLALLVNRVLVSFEETKLYAKKSCLWSKSAAGYPRLCCNPQKIIVTGNPVPAEIRLADKVLKTDSTKFKILITGGSQGARGLNLAVKEAMRCLPDIHNYDITHQTGALERELVESAYQQMNMQVRVKSFITNMAEEYAKADLVICRAGASTLAEIAAMGKAAIFIPYPYSAYNHQELNAKTMVQAKAAEMIREAELSGELLAQRIMFYRNNPEVLNKMGKCAKGRAKLEAGGNIVGWCYEVMEK